MASREEYWDLALKILFIEEQKSQVEYLECLNGLASYLYGGLNINKLYRYRPGDWAKWERDRPLFKEDRIWLQPMDKQNDPFEYSFSMNLNNVGEISSIKQQFNAFASKLSIACFCEKKDNILMWSHYADSHQGYCIEYPTIPILEEFQWSLLPVIYQEQIPCVSDVSSEKIDNGLWPYFIALKSISSKASLWKPEQEWRVIRKLESGGEAVNFPKPTAVYLGCKICAQLESELKAICHNKNIPVFKMQKDAIAYKLNQIEM